MPITINNFFPQLILYLVLILEVEKCIRVLVDAGATTNADNMDYHVWVMSQCPEMVVEYLQYDPNVDFDAVQRLAVLYLNV